MQGQAHRIALYQDRCQQMVAPKGMRLAGPGSLQKARQHDKTLKVRCTKPKRVKS
jgi:hypothetical protein